MSIQKYNATLNRVSASFAKISKLIDNHVDKYTMHKKWDCWFRLHDAFRKKYHIRAYSRSKRDNMDIMFAIALAPEGNGKGMLNELEQLATEMFT